MNARSVVKALLIKGQKILLIKGEASSAGIYYTLPGGGQNKYETMSQAMIRECLEETGYLVQVERMAAVYEEIYTSATTREKNPVHAHRIIHVFLCAVSDELPTTPTEMDEDQIEAIWIDVQQVKRLPLYPTHIGDHIDELLYSTHIVDLGSHLIDRIEPL